MTWHDLLVAFFVGLAAGDALCYFGVVVAARRDHAEGHAAWCEADESLREEMRLERQRYKMEVMYWRAEAVARGAPRGCSPWHERGTRPG